MSKKAPGKSHREGMSVAELFAMFPDDATAEAWFAEQRWPDGVHCPFCGSVNVQTGAKHAMPYRCRERECRKRFSVKTGTVMQSSNLGFQTWAIATYLALTNLKSVASMKLHRDLKITQKSAWHLAHRLREAFDRHGEAFGGPVEVDESYFGGERKNMSNAKRRAYREAGSPRGPVDKTIVVGVKNRGTNEVRAKVVTSTDGRTLQGFVRENTEPGATVYSDESASYTGLARDFDHEAVNHSAGEYIRGQAGINGMESFWGGLKRAHKGTFHKISPKHLDRYVGEFAGKHNVRDADTVAQMASLAAGMAGKRLRYQDLIADNGLPSGARS